MLINTPKEHIIKQHAIATDWKPQRHSIPFPQHPIIKHDISSAGKSMLKIIIIQNFSCDFSKITIAKTLAIKSYASICLYIGARLFNGWIGSVAGIWYLIGASAVNCSFFSKIQNFLKIGHVKTLLSFFVIFIWLSQLYDRMLNDF